MTCVLINGQRSWAGSRNDEGHREYSVLHLVKAAFLDGPSCVMQTPGLPMVGSTWLFDDDIDVWAWCTPYIKVSIHEEKEGEKNRWWKVENKYTTKPISRCDIQMQDPLTEPMKISGSFVKDKIEAQRDRFGFRIRSSSHEQIRGDTVMFDANRPTVHIEQNRLNLNLDILAALGDVVNDAPMWELPARCVKLSTTSWERLVYTQTVTPGTGTDSCTYYYKRSFDFDINFNTFDRKIQDQGTKVLNGYWAKVGNEFAWVVSEVAPGVAANRNNATHFIRYKDPHGELSRVFLDGYGLPANVEIAFNTGTGTGVGVSGTVGDNEVAERTIEYYPEADLLTLLSLPSSL